MRTAPGHSGAVGLVGESWLDQLLAEVRPVFEHLLAHGSLTEE